MARQTMILDSQRAELLANWTRGCELAYADREDEHDPRPVVKLFNPCGRATWLLTELKPDEDGGDPDIAFGLCDLGSGFPELGYVSLSDLSAVRLPFGMYIERDEHFTASKTISDYTQAARIARRIEA